MNTTLMYLSWISVYVKKACVTIHLSRDFSGQNLTSQMGTYHTKNLVSQMFLNLTQRSLLVLSKLESFRLPKYFFLIWI